MVKAEKDTMKSFSKSKLRTFVRVALTQGLRAYENAIPVVFTFNITKH